MNRPRTTKANRTGRNEQYEHYTKMLRSTMETPAWRALSTTAQALYPWLKLEWKGTDYNNNGRIQLSIKQAAKKLGVSINTANKAFHHLQAKGFIVVTEMGALGVSGVGKSPKYELTELGHPNSNSFAPQRLYIQWEPSQEFAVQMHHASNGLGANGIKIPSQKLRRPHLKNSDV